jgi:type I restriction enzyme, S subunit
MTGLAYPIYDSYRDDIAPWLGEVPADWRFEKAKWFLSHRKNINSDGKIDNVLSLTLRGVVNNDPDNPEGLVPKDYRTYQIFGRNDLVFKLIDLENVRTSRVGLVHEQGIMSSAYIRIVPPKGWNARFLYYYYFHMYQAEVFNKIGSGVRSTLGQSDLLDLPIPVLDCEVQDNIVRFLDEKTSKIDAAIALEERQISLLKERKQIVIQNAVTKGLDPNAPMKDSGVDWIGDIPAHWGVFPLFSKTRIKSLSNCADRELLSVYLDLGVVKFSDVDEKRANATSLDLSTYQAVDPGDFVLNNQQAWRGSVGVSMHAGIVSPAYIVLALSPDFDPEFANYYFRSPALVSHYLIGSKGVGTIQRNLYWPKLRTTAISIPPIDEQIEIVEYIRTETEKIDRAISLKNDQIKALREYKATLINSAVTGKIKVA